ncbi:DNA-binding protein K10-like isoform X2 [Toxorhynchites rutilus septentrionalis]|uniref:DNA-binding protein K10-like isoform X2 n=1 Tax=Toxorhynchites rutilus septentrionalis TaxID=329112 RepID=UPI00247908F4|nr:DNA-binding protein K10-like isoform X2 [Toxorhynchites rutilus septentrionalis]
MVSTKAVQNKRRGGFNGIPDRQRFKPGGGHKPLNPRNMGAMFNANQLGDNPGFLDFNDDVQIPPATTTQTNGNSATTKATPATGNIPAASSSASTTSGSVKGPMRGNNRKGNLNQKRQLMRNGNNMRRIPPGMNNHWGPLVPPVPHMFPMGGGRRNGPLPPPPPHFRVPPMGPRGMRGGPMMPPPPPNGRFVGPPMGPGPMSLMQRPLPPMPPMRGPMMTPMGRMIPPPLRNRADGPPMMRRNPNGKLLPSRGGKVTKITARNVIVNGKGLKSVAKNLKPKVPAKPREEYPLDKPWITEEIKAEHDKKVELADRLKGNKDDALFAQFKEQRDRFVKMYDAARLEFIGKHPEQR